MYLATLISNVLRKNSAVDHQKLATRIHRVIERLHPQDISSEPTGLSFNRNLIGYEEKRRERLLISETQGALSKLGYKIDRVDGILGLQTAEAIKKFQESQNMTVDGKISKELLNRLIHAASGR